MQDGDWLLNQLPDQGPVIIIDQDNNQVQGVASLEKVKSALKFNPEITVKDCLVKGLITLHPVFNSNSSYNI